MSTISNKNNQEIKADFILFPIPLMQLHKKNMLFSDGTVREICPLSLSLRSTCPLTVQLIMLISKSKSGGESLVVRKRMHLSCLPAFSAVWLPVLSGEEEEGKYA